MKKGIGLDVVKRILYQDNHLVIINKPVGIKVQPDSSLSLRVRDDDLFSLIKDYLRVSGEKPGDAYLGLVHRLDRLTSGVMVFAKTSKSAARLSLAFSNHSVRKRYLCLVKGKIPSSGSCVDYIDDTVNPVQIISQSKFNSGGQLWQNYKPARLHYTPLTTFESIHGECSALQIELETGRKHQIRAQLSSMGHPILGDTKYHSKVLNPTGKFVALHSHELIIPHPITKENLSFRAPLPVEWIGSYLSESSYRGISSNLDQKFQEN